MKYLKAVIMAAGSGSRLSEVASGMPKCLLPIGNQPMIWYPILWLRKCGFKNIIILVGKDQLQKVETILNSRPLSDIEYQFIGVESDYDWGTGDSLRQINNLIEDEALVVSCDLITDLNLSKMLSKHYSSMSSITILTAPKIDYTWNVPGEKKNKDDSLDVIYTSSDSRLAHFDVASTMDKTTKLPMAAFSKCRLIHSTPSQADMHLYLIKKPVINYLEKMETITSIKKELIPALVKKQYNESLVDSDDDEFEQDASVELKKLSLAVMAQVDTKINGDSDELCCIALEEKDGFHMRADNLGSYAALNSKFDKFLPNKEDQFCLSSMKNKASLVANDAQIEPKVSLANSTIGSATVIKTKSQIKNCVIMNNVKIDEGCNLENCFILPNAHIGSLCELKGCIIGEDVELEPETKLKDQAHHNDLDEEDYD